MKNLTSSASKIVFLVVTATVCFAFLYEIFTGLITFDAKDFYALALMVFTFYFTKSPTPSVSTTTADTAIVSTGIVEK